MVKSSTEGSEERWRSACWTQSPHHTIFYSTAIPCAVGTKHPFAPVAQGFTLPAISQEKSRAKNRIPVPLLCMFFRVGR